MENNETKSITYNAVIRKQLIKTPIKDKNRKRVGSENWTFDLDCYKYDNQLKMITNILDNKYNHSDEVSKIAIQQIHRKIYGYKQQDIIKKLFNSGEFITFESIINKMCQCELKCYYCFCEMNILYDISREMKQWTVDRINNDLGHNLTNYYLACLECNLKRRRRSDEKFLFTKQMKIIKVFGENNDNPVSLI